ncbi:MAG TPA: ATP-binding cassette domain-containing protein [Thermoanaerobaculia bacterium]|nr:ATP-binding cassette domain-containing protein [Thermoanaerobaculia bacterium]
MDPERLAGARRRRLVPEVIQSSAMDCGPACLHALLLGHGLRASYGRLREVCRTDVDGTSIDTLELVAGQLGLAAEQVVIPVDHLLVASAGALPALVVTVGADGLTHFVVAWRLHRGGVVQVMDPVAGRRWPRADRFLSEVYVHQLPVPWQAFREWAGTSELRRPLGQRMEGLGVGAEARSRLGDAALEDPGWRGPASLDAAVRTVAALVDAGAVRRGGEASRLLDRLFREAREDPDVLPPEHWTVRPSEGDPEQLLLRGAVLVRVRGAATPAPPPRDGADAAAGLGAASVAAVIAPEPGPGRQLLELWGREGKGRLATWLAGAGLAALVVTVEALLFRGLLDAGLLLGTGLQRAAGWMALVVFVLAALGLTLSLESESRGFGRRIEGGLRRRFLDKLPRIEDRYFRSRPVSDMAERGHTLHRLRATPDGARRFVQGLGEVALTTAGMAWLHPPLGWAAVAASTLSIAVPLLAQPALSELDLKVRSHLGSLARVYQEAMVGLVAVRSHGAERVLRREHERLLGEWMRASVDFLRWHVRIEGVQIVATLAAVAWILVDALAAGAAPGAVLLLAYWGLHLPFRGRQVVYRAQQLARERNVALRAVEPLGAPERDTPGPAGEEPPPDPSATRGMGLALRGVTVELGGRAVLADVDLEVAPGEHLAVVGPSGAGKTTLLGLLLGWHPPSRGEVEIDGRPLESVRLDSLRSAIAWVDPAVRLWNRSLLRNLTYGNPSGPVETLPRVLDAAALRDVLERLPTGLQTSLGEGGGLLSGGEGQRVRLGRALSRSGVRLALLDEPFRGLGRDQRRQLLARARRWWRGATLICVTHDVADAAGFDRVVVVSDGRIVEDGDPAALATAAGSPYAALAEADREVRERVWSRARWRSWWVEGGTLAEAPPGEGP